MNRANYLAKKNTTWEPQVWKPRSPCSFVGAKSTISICYMADLLVVVHILEILIHDIQHNLLVLSREWMGCWGNGMIITSDYGSFPHPAKHQ